VEHLTAATRLLLLPEVVVREETLEPLEPLIRAAVVVDQTMAAQVLVVLVLSLSDLRMAQHLLLPAHLQ
jgi:hypothetical protein